MVEVTRVREVNLRWHPMSLYLLHEARGQAIPDRLRASALRGRSLGRVLVAAQARVDDEMVGRLYAALHTGFHVEREASDRRLVEQALDRTDLPREIVEALDDASYDETLLRHNHEAVARVGDELGSPVVAFNGTAFFGPVLTRAPRGEEAGRLWDGVMAVTSFPHFYEIKRSRTEMPAFD